MGGYWCCVVGLGDDSSSVNIPRHTLHGQYIYVAQ
jgi:hypothetical protein